MKRKLNYTGRMKIERKNISINFISESGGVVAFTVTKLDLTGLNLPPEAKVYVEAYYRTELRRFDFGTAGSITNPSPCDLRGMAYPENLKFRILVVAPSDGKLLAQGDRISLKKSGERKSILPVEFSDLGNEIWLVKYEGDADSPILIINSRIPGIQNIACRDAQFLTYVYPAVIREILAHMVFVDGVDSITEPSVDWHGDWLRFVRLLGVEIPEILNKDGDNFDKQKALKWIEDSVLAFCSTHSHRFQEYIRRQEETSLCT